MRATIELDEDSAKAVEVLRRDEGLGVSDAVNALIRRARIERGASAPFRQPTHQMGLKIGVSSVTDAVDLLEGVQPR